MADIRNHHTPARAQNAGDLFERRKPLFLAMDIMEAKTGEDYVKRAVGKRQCARVAGDHSNAACNIFKPCVQPGRGRRISRLILHLPDINPKGAPCLVVMAYGL
jgi:hypothetical protein